MPLFISDEELRLLAGDTAAVAERADAAIRELRRQVDTVRAEAELASSQAEVNLADTSAAKESRIQEVEAKFTQCQAICNINQEKEQLEKHNLWLDEELKAKVKNLAELKKTNMDKEARMSARIAEAVFLEREISESSSSLRRSKERISELEQRLSYMEKVNVHAYYGLPQYYFWHLFFLIFWSPKDAAAANEQRLGAELSTVMKLAKLHKESSELWSKKAEELEGVIKALETHLTQVEDEYKEKLEKETLSRRDHEKEAANLKQKLEKCEFYLENIRKSNELSLIPLTSRLGSGGVSRSWPDDAKRDLPPSPPPPAFASDGSHPPLPPPALTSAGRSPAAFAGVLLRRRPPSLVLASTGPVARRLSPSCGAASRTPFPRRQLSIAAMDAERLQAEMVSPAARVLAMGIFEKMDVKNLQKILRRKNERGLTGQKLKIIANSTVKLENLKMNQLKIICGANNLKCPRTAKKADLIMILNNHRRFLEESSINKDRLLDGEEKNVSARMSDYFPTL
ncbi:hypothetical protein U9M48_022072 [Paspalum notatum var. saurae]|uniref:Nucleoprotein TPR/MPL1 domain-containing protein n=1 Tax=Paspalum notatum var. saurae TaxID=547442 RepID=A0AAQ3TJ33_PASNO